MKRVLTLCVLAVVFAASCSQSNKPEETKGNSSEGSTQVDPGEPQGLNLEVVDSGFSVVQDFEGLVVTWAVVLRNPNVELIPDLVEVRPNFQNVDGVFLDASGFAGLILPGQLGAVEAHTTRKSVV